MGTKIEWAEETWNPITGCTQISEGCRNCYAKRMANRMRGRFGYPEDDPFRVTVHYNKLHIPKEWKSGRMVFVCSMGDIFHEDVKSIDREEVFSVMKSTPQHTYLLLTKRAQEMQDWLIWYYAYNKENILKNIWTGVSVEKQAAADERIPWLLQTPAAKRFVSCEPLLGPVDLRLIRREPCSHVGCFSHISHPCEGCGYQGGRLPIDWVIAGGETGPGSRPMHPDWGRSLRDQCQAAGVPFFFKSWGKYRYSYRMFQTEQNWIDKGAGWLNGDAKFVCVDMNGKELHCGADFMKAKYPVAYGWPGIRSTSRLLDSREWNEFPEGGG